MQNPCVPAECSPQELTRVHPLILQSDRQSFATQSQGNVSEESQGQGGSLWSSPLEFPDESEVDIESAEVRKSTSVAQSLECAPKAWSLRRVMQA